MKEIIFIVLFFCVGVVNAQKNFKDGKLSFISVDKVPIIKGILNGKEAYFIIDSGASISVLDENKSDKYEFFMIQSEGEIAGYGGHSSPKETESVSISVGGIDFSGEYLAQDITSIVDVIIENGGIEISGIIGSNIMKELGLIIDFDSNALYVRDFVTILPIKPLQPNI